MFQNNPYFQPNMPQNQLYQRPAFQPQQMYPQPILQDNTPQIRFVASREEAIAATVIPGIPCFFVNRAQNMLYYKAIDPQSGTVEFKDYAEVQPAQQTPQYVTLEALNALRGDIEQMIDQRINALQTPRQTGRKAVNSNDE